MSRIQIFLPCLYDKDFENKAQKSITIFLNKHCSKNESIDTLVRKAHDLTRRYFDSSLIRKIVVKWKKTS